MDDHDIEAGENMKTVVRRFLNSGMSTAEMDVSGSDSEKILRSE